VIGFIRKKNLAWEILMMVAVILDLPFGKYYSVLGLCLVLQLSHAVKDVMGIDMECSEWNSVELISLHIGFDRGIHIVWKLG